MRKNPGIWSLPLLCASLGVACGSTVDVVPGAGTAGAPTDGGSLAGSPNRAGAAGRAGGTEVIGGSGTTAGAGGAEAGAASTPPGRELCGLEATCSDGKIHGVLGNNCHPFSTTCEFGCREASYNHDWLGPDHDHDVTLADQLARAALCNDDESGAGGSSESVGSGSGGTVSGVSMPGGGFVGTVPNGGYGGAVPNGGYGGAVPNGGYGGAVPNGGFGGAVPNGGYGGGVPEPPGGFGGGGPVPGGGFGGGVLEPGGGFGGALFGGAQ